MKNKNIDELRKHIDQIDDQLLALLAKRLVVATEIGRKKREQGAAILDRVREEALLRRLAQRAQALGLPQDFTTDLWHMLFKASKARQENMHSVYLNNTFVSEENALIPITTHALHYGAGVFEGIRAYYSQEKNALLLFRLKDHFERMEKNCKILQIKLPMSVDGLCKTAVELVKKNFAKKDLYIRPLAYKSDPAVGNFTLTTLADGFVMYAIPLGRHFKKDSVHAMISSYERVSGKAIPPRGKITGAYANTCLAKTEAIQKGYDEALFLNREGNIAEASAENVFVVKDGELLTPPITDDILEGITRDTVMTLAKEELGLAVAEKSITKDALLKADEVFLTGTGAEINPVTMIDDRKIRNGEIGTVSKNIQEIYNKLVHGKLDRYQRWLTLLQTS